MKKLFAVIVLMVLLSVTSCQTRVVSSVKPMQKNSIELYKKYTIQTQDAKEVKVEVVRVDDEKIYGKTKSGEEVVINKSDVREVRKFNLLPSIAIGVAAVAAVIFIPM
ncbi:MAG: hypothetical protein BGO40_09380 [Chryseobacterium sp. 39-10]|nr:bacteriophage spanin2 family protein [Chryseobacterium sp.]OJV46188.1 MAG: hypothetical protein BGO40_09380 [Chryseobacterium sp. 39-10]